MKNLALLVASFCFFISHIHAQDSTKVNSDSAFVLKPGFYKSYEELTTNSPSLIKEFKVIWSYSVNSDGDSVATGFTYLLPDSGKIKEKIYGFCDGRKVYLRYSNNTFLQMDYVGRFSFIALNRSYLESLFTASSTTSTVLSILLFAPIFIPFSEEDICYFNKKSEFKHATVQAISWLLRDDKDFLKEFNAEKKINNEVFKKYLIKMNERYPISNLAKP
jgi:hypothetical protein